jgi:hypothetical protein
MFAYEYLKQNPQLNGSLITQGRRTLSTGPKIPDEVKRELKKLRKLTPKITDAKLYWYGWSREHCLVDHRTVHICDEVWNANDWLTYLYSFVQINPERRHQAELIFKNLTASLVVLPLTYKEVALCCSTYDSKQPLAYRVFKMFNNHCEFSVYSSESNMLNVLFVYFTLDFIRKATMGQLRAIKDLYRDTPQPDPGKKYKSFNEFMAAHDAWTKAETLRLIQEASGHIVYTKEFLDIVNGRGFRLPAVKSDLIIRGSLHHNCVVTYTNRHCKDIAEEASDGECTRLVFARDATGELNIRWRHGRIVSVHCNQYKGPYNKNFEVPEAMTDLQIALTGRSKNILHVQELIDAET